VVSKWEPGHVSVQSYVTVWLEHFMAVSHEPMGKLPQSADLVLVSTIVPSSNHTTAQI
jgi:hypothetical protein